MSPNLIRAPEDLKVPPRRLWFSEAFLSFLDNLLRYTYTFKYTLLTLYPESKTQIRAQYLRGDTGSATLIERGYSSLRRLSPSCEVRQYN